MLRTGEGPEIEALRPRLGGQQENPMTARIVDNHIELTEEDARAGQTGVHVRYILMRSIGLAVLAFFAIAILI